MVFFYFSRHVPSDLQTRFNKKREVISLRTLSEPKALTSAIKLAERLETFWITLRLELFHTKELKLSFLDNEKIISEKLKLSDALNIYLKLKGKGKDVLFARTANRNVSYAIECFGDIDINLIKPIDAENIEIFFCFFSLCIE